MREGRQRIAAPRLCRSLHARSIRCHRADPGIGHRPAQSRLRKSDFPQRWLADGDTGERRPRWLTPVRYRGEARGHQCQRACRGDRAPWQTGVRAILQWTRRTLGNGRGPHEFDATTKHDMRSVSKSVTSLLVGIAIDRELIKGVDEPILKFFPDYAAVKTAGWDKVTLRHLLTMTSGMQWDQNRPWADLQNDERQLSFDADPFRYVLSKPIQHLRTLSGITTAAERTCSAMSSSAYRASRWKCLRVRRCSPRSASRTGNG